MINGQKGHPYFTITLGILAGRAVPYTRNRCCCAIVQRSYHAHTQCLQPIRANHGNNRQTSYNVLSSKSDCLYIVSRLSGHSSVASLQPCSRTVPVTEPGAEPSLEKTGMVWEIQIYRISHYIRIRVSDIRFRRSNVSSLRRCAWLTGWL